jgi:hypothetical protein
MKSTQCTLIHERLSTITRKHFAYFNVRNKTNIIFYFTTIVLMVLVFLSCGYICIDIPCTFCGCFSILVYIYIYIYIQVFLFFKLTNYIPS